jgi:hypothetical protein
LKKNDETVFSGGILHHRREVFSDYYRQLQPAEELFKLSTMNEKSSFVKFPVVITKEIKLYFNNSSRKPTQYPNP